MFNSLRIFTIWLSHSKVWVFSYLHILTHYYFLPTIATLGVSSDNIMILVCISLMTNDVKYVSMYIMSTSTSPLLYSPAKSFPYFLEYLYSYNKYFIYSGWSISSMIILINVSCRLSLAFSFQINFILHHALYMYLYVICVCMYMHVSMYLYMTVPFNLCALAFTQSNQILYLVF
jgi:hypothetical protein